MAKKAKKRARAPKELTRKQLSRLERERRMERWLIVGVAFVGIAIVGILGYGLVAEKVIKAREPVAVVGGTPITVAEFQARVRFVRMRMQIERQNWLVQQQSLNMTNPNADFYLEYIQGKIHDVENQLSSANALVIGEQVLDQLVLEELVRQEAERRDITVTPEELQQEIERYFGYDRNPSTPAPASVATSPPATFPLTPTEVLTPTPTVAPLPTPTPISEADFRQRYNDSLKSWKSLGVSERQYRSWIEALLLLEELQGQIGAEVPDTADQFKVRYLRVDSEERANELAARLDNGEDFQALSEELREDDEVTGFGTELGWYPQSVLEERIGAELAKLAFNLEVGEHSQPVLSEDGTQYTIIEVVGHEVHELASYILEQMKDEAFQKWVEAQKQVTPIEYPPVKTDCRGDTPWYKDECRRSWRDRDPTVCRWALFWPCAGSWRDRVPMEP
ncbi:MAG: peptidylprolyl isomerase [Anaerolineae bacterium]